MRPINTKVRSSSSLRQEKGATVPAKSLTAESACWQERGQCWALQTPPTSLGKPVFEHYHALQEKVLYLYFYLLEGCTICSNRKSTIRQIRCYAEQRRDISLTTQN